MNTFKDLIERVLPKYNNPFVDPNYMERTAVVVNKIFEIMAANKTAFHVAYPTQESVELAMSIWTEAFMDVGLNDYDLIKNGLRKLFLLENPFAITVGHFIKLCKPIPEDLGLPDMDEAYKEAVALSHPQSGGNWSHPAIRKAVNEIGSFSFRQMSAKESRHTFEKAYSKVCEDVSKGEELKKLPNNDEKEPLRFKTEAEKNWEDYRKGKNNVEPPLSGWFNQEAQDRLYEEKMADYRKVFGERGVEIPDYSHLNSRDKAMPVIKSLLEKMGNKSQFLKD
jgi:hypothetical protein